MIKGNFFEDGNSLKYGMIGGGPDSFIGPVHRTAISMNGRQKLLRDVFLVTMKSLSLLQKN